MLGLAALLGLADAFEKPTRQSFLVEIVGPESVRNAVSLNSVMVNAPLPAPAWRGWSSRPAAWACASP